MTLLQLDTVFGGANIYGLAIVFMVLDSFQQHLKMFHLILLTFVKICSRIHEFHLLLAKDYWIISRSDCDLDHDSVIEKTLTRFNVTIQHHISRNWYFFKIWNSVLLMYTVLLLLLLKNNSIVICYGALMMLLFTTQGQTLQFF